MSFMFYMHIPGRFSDLKTANLQASSQISLKVILFSLHLKGQKDDCFPNFKFIVCSLHRLLSLLTG